MKQKVEIWKTVLFVLGAVLIMGLFITVDKSKGSDKFPVTLENCQPGTWIGGVIWSEDRTTYEDVPEIELKQAGSITVMLSPAVYSITHYRPPKLMYNGWQPAAILDYRDIVVSGKSIHTFGCEE